MVCYHTPKGEFKMGFEDKRNELKNSMGSYYSQNENQSVRRTQKSYTLQPELAKELAKRAKNENLTASRYLENLLKEVFNQQ